MNGVHTVNRAHPIDIAQDPKVARSDPAPLCEDAIQDGGCWTPGRAMRPG